MTRHWQNNAVFTELYKWRRIRPSNFSMRGCSLIPWDVLCWSFSSGHAFSVRSCIRSVSCSASRRESLGVAIRRRHQDHIQTGTGRRRFRIRFSVSNGNTCRTASARQRPASSPFRVMCIFLQALLISDKDKTTRSTL